MSLETKLTGSVPRRSAIRRHSLARLMIAQRITRSIRFEESIVDSEGCLPPFSLRSGERFLYSEGCLHAFASCRNDKLHTTTGISRGINTGDVGSGVFAALNAISIFAKFADETLGQMRALILPRGEKQCASRKKLAIGKPNSFQLVTLAL